MCVPLISVLPLAWDRGDRQQNFEDAGMKMVFFRVRYKLLPCSFISLWESFIAALCTAVYVGLLGCLLDFDAINVFHLLSCGNSLGVLLRVMETVKGEEDMVPAMVCRDHMGCN